MIKRTLYFGNPAYLSMRNAQLVLRLPEVEHGNVTEQFKREAERTIPIEDIGVVILDNNRITITSGLLAALIENNCAVITCDNSRMPNGMMLSLNGNSIQNERARTQLSISQPLRKQLWQQTVQSKIANQMALLKQYRPNAEIGNMRAWIKEVKSDDAYNLEARAAAYYWKCVFPTLPEFTRGREGIPPNNLLNYGYAMLRAIVARSIVGVGLIPTIGLHHHNRYNAYCLADDIMVPYRPYVDELVIQIVDTNECVDELTRDLKARMLSLPVLEVKIAGHRSPLMVAVDTTTMSLYKCMSGQSRKIIYPEF